MRSLRHCAENNTLSSENIFVSVYCSDFKTIIGTDDVEILTYYKYLFSKFNVRF